MKKLNVLYSFPLRIGTSGTGMTAWYQVTGLINKNINVLLFAGSCEKKIDGLDYLKETLKPFKIKFPIRLIGVKRAAILHDIYTSKVLKRIKNKVNIVHCWPLGSKNTLKMARILGIKTFLERPNTHTQYAYEVVKNEYLKLGLKQHKSHSHTYNASRVQLEKREYELADKILCPSSFVAHTFIQQSIPENKLAFHHYGFDSMKFKISTKKNDKKFNLVFIGLCEPRKGLHYALTAWLNSEACKNGKFYICGRFDKDYKKLLNNMLLHKSIEETGFIDNVPQLLQKCHALILPSIEEGSALVTYEAKACGDVLLVSEATGAHCKHMYDSLIHKVGDVDTIKKHINMLYLNNDLYQRLQRNSILSSIDFTWEKAADILIRIYNNSN